MMDSRGCVCVILSMLFSTSMSFTEQKYGVASKKTSELKPMIEQKFLGNDQELRSPSPSTSFSPSQSPSSAPSVNDTMMPSLTHTINATTINMDNMAVTLTIQNMTAEEVDQHLMNEKSRDAILFSVREHINWFAINDLTLDYEDSTKQELKTLFKQFFVSMSEMSTSSRRRLRLKNDQVQIETTFSCTAELIEIDENNKDEKTLKKYRSILSDYQIESFKGQPALSFLTLLQARNITLLDKTTAVESKLISARQSGKIVEADISTSKDEGNLFDKWIGGDRWKRSALYGGLGFGVLVAMATLIYVQVAKKKKLGKKTEKEEDQTISSQDFPLREVENNPSVSRNSQSGYSFPSDETAVSSMWDTTTQKDDCKYFEYVERIKPTPIANSSHENRSKKALRMNDSSRIQRNENKFPTVITEDGEMMEESTRSEYVTERYEMSDATPTNVINESDYDSSVQLNSLHTTTHDATTVRGRNPSHLRRDGHDEKFGSPAQEQGNAGDIPTLKGFQDSVKKVFNIWE